MSIQVIKVRVPDLEIGMYVTRLNRPWIDTPYMIQGFHIDDQKDIEKISKYCEYVFVDAGLSKDRTELKHESLKETLINAELKQQLTGVKPKHYKNKTSLEKELKVARVDHKELTDAAKDIMADISNNKTIQLPLLKASLNPMIDSITRNPEAFSWLTMMKTKDDYTYNHAVSSSVWAVAFGRHLGLPKEDLRSLAIGTLLIDTGKMKLPERLINNPNRFNPTEFKIIQQHVAHSVEIVQSIKGLNSKVVQMVLTHHERHNGHGYPKGLVGNDIPVFGKIAGIVDCYDALISERAYVSAISPHDAINKLYGWRDIDFQAGLIEQFIQVVGIYPVGTIVELSDQRIGVIVAHHRAWRLRPKVMLLLDKDKEPFEKFNIIDMYTEETGTDGLPLSIIKNVEPHTYGIDPKQFFLQE